MIIPEISPIAGDNADGFVDSSVMETLLTSVMETQEKCIGPTVYYLDRSSSSLQIIDKTSDATNAAAVAGGLAVGAFYRTSADPSMVAIVY